MAKWNVPQFQVVICCGKLALSHSHRCCFYPKKRLHHNGKWLSFHPQPGIESSIIDCRSQIDTPSAKLIPSWMSQARAESFANTS